MGIELTFLRSKVARRVFMLLMLSALVPAMIMAALTLNHVSELLNQQSHEQLRQASKNYGLTIKEKLTSIRDGLYETARQIRLKNNSKDSLSEYNNGRTKAVALIWGNGEIMPVSGRMDAHIDLLLLSQEYLLHGKSILFYKESPSGQTQVFMGVMLHEKPSENGMLIAEIDPSYLWEDKKNHSYMVDFCALNESKQLLYCSRPVPDTVSADISLKLAESPSGNLEWRFDDENILAGYWNLFLKPDFNISGWTIIAHQPEHYATAATASFKSIFIPVILISLFIVALVSIAHIRRTLNPIEKLIDGTRRIANNNFESQVSVSSGDEFETLASSFNTMSTHLARQFNALTVFSDIDRFILSTPDLDQIPTMVLTRMRNIIPCDIVAIAITDCDAPESAQRYISTYDNDDKFIKERIVLSDADKQLLLDNPDELHSDSSQELIELMPLARYGASTVYILPVIFEKNIYGMIGLGYRNHAGASNEDLTFGRDLADRLAVTFSIAARDEELYTQTHYDVLTGLPNRQLLKDRLSQEIIHAKRENKTVAVLYIDLDHFQKINDAYGHAVGDQLLRSTAERLRGCVRETSTIARLSGDEFTVILPGIDTPIDVGHVAENIIRALAEPFNINNNDNYISASIGIALYPTDGSNVDDLVKNADTAMCRAKKNGRDRYLFFTENMNFQALERITLERELRLAIERDEFILYYQPKITLRTGMVESAEALIRWQHPDRGFVSPDQFIPVVEDSGLMDAIGDWVIRTACKQFKSWEAEGIDLHSVAVNVSASQFKQNNFIDKIKMAVNDTGMQPSNLEVEITESACLDNIEATIDTLNKLSSYGINISLDDFGTGYSSLSYLKQLPFDNLKIDRSFIMDVCSDENSSAIAKSIIALGMILKKRIIAEGVEDEEQLNFLRGQNCSVAQGYYYSPPLPPEKFSEYIRKTNKISAA